MPAIAEHFDNHGCARESEVDTNQSVTSSAEHLLRHRPCNARCVEQTQEFTLQPTVRAAGDLDAFDHSEQVRYPVSTLSAQRMNPPMKEVLREQSVAQGTVKCCGQYIPRGHRGKIDEGASGSSHGESEGGFTVEEVQRLRRVDHYADPADVAFAGCQKVKGRCKPKALETDQRAGGRRAEPARLANIVDEGRERDVVVWLEAALDSASKLRGELTVDDRRAAVLRVHAAESIVRSSPMQLSSF